MRIKSAMAAAICAAASGLVLGCATKENEPKLSGTGGAVALGSSGTTGTGGTVATGTGGTLAAGSGGVTGVAGTGSGGVPAGTGGVAAGSGGVSGGTGGVSGGTGGTAAGSGGMAGGTGGMTGGGACPNAELADFGITLDACCTPEGQCGIDAASVGMPGCTGLAEAAEMAAAMGLAAGTLPPPQPCPM